MKHALLALFLFTSVVAADDQANDKLLKDLTGSYTIAGFEKAGEADAGNFAKTIQAVTIKGNKLTMSFKEEGKTDEKSATITVDASKKPIHIDLKPADGPKKDELVLGVLEVGEDTLKLCWNDGPKKRPTDATSTKENKNFLITLKRVKE